MINKGITYMRKNSKLSQEKLSKIINIAPTTISGWETNYRQPTFEMIEKIANICGYKIYFINEKEKDKFQIKDLIRKDI